MPSEASLVLFLEQVFWGKPPACLVISPGKIRVVSDEWMRHVLSSGGDDDTRITEQRSWRARLSLQTKRASSLLVRGRAWFVCEEIMRHSLIERSWSASLFLQKKMRQPHYFFRKKRAFFSEEIMRSYICFWRNNEAEITKGSGQCASVYLGKKRAKFWRKFRGARWRLDAGRLHYFFRKKRFCLKKWWGFLCLSKKSGPEIAKGSASLFIQMRMSLRFF